MAKLKIGRKMKRKIVKMALGAALLLGIGFSPHNIVLADKGVNTGEDTEYKSVEDSDNVKFNEDGDIFFETTDRKATNAIKYKTLGFYAALQKVNSTTEVDTLSPSWKFD